MDSCDITNRDKTCSLDTPNNFNHIENVNVHEASEDVQEASKEVQVASKDAQETSKDVQVASKEVQEASKEVQEASKEVLEASKEVHEAPEDVQETPKDVQETPKDVQETSDVQVASKEVHETSKDVQETSDVQVASKDVQETSKDVQETSKDVQETSKDVQETPKDVEEACDVQEASKDVQKVSEDLQNTPMDVDDSVQTPVKTTRASKRTYKQALRASEDNSKNVGKTSGGGKKNLRTSKQVDPSTDLQSSNPLKLSSWQAQMKSKRQKIQNFFNGSCTSSSDHKFEVGTVVYVKPNSLDSKYYAATIVNYHNEGDSCLVRIHESNSLKNCDVKDLKEEDPNKGKEPTETSPLKKSVVMTRGRKKLVSVVEPSIEVEKSPTTPLALKRLSNHNRKGYDDYGLAIFGEKY